jgi:hypothetical protein
MVASPYHLATILNDYEFDPPEKETIDITYRVFLWMAFAGLTEKDAIKVTAKDVDLANFQIHFEGNDYELYKECKTDFEKACTLTEFMYYHPHYGVRPRKRVEGDTIMRGFLSSEIQPTTIRALINKRFDPMKYLTEEQRKQKGIDEDLREAKLSYKRIYLSGIFYREYERERIGLPVNFSTVVAKEMKQREKERGKSYTTTPTRTYVTIANKLEREYLTDYEKWKCAFTF